MSSRRILRVLVLATLGACASTAVTRESLIRIPEHAARTSGTDVRGTARDAARIPPDEQFVILGEVVRRFYRPMMQYARWIDPRPLSNRRTRQADTVMQGSADWAQAIVDAARMQRVCPLNEANEQCRGRLGGILRFSPPYGVGAPGKPGVDSALVYVRYSPVHYGVENEIEFLLARHAGGWQILSRRLMPDIPEGTATLAGGAVVDPQVATDSLLATDRAFAAAAKATDLVTAISSMFVTNVVMQSTRGHVRGRDAAIEALTSDTANRRSRAEWTPVFAGVSSDGEQGFTTGYMSITRPDGSVLPAKYVAYWVHGEAGWRVAAYKRVPRAIGDVSLTPYAPSLPTRALPRGDPAAQQRYADELSLAEHAFARDAGAIGLGPAFEKWGAPDAVNNGGGRTVAFVRGPQEIAKSVTTNIPSDVQITWAPEQVIVASTGDLGVSIGTIRLTMPATADKAASTRDVPFFTIWKRAWPTDPWRYVAE